MLVRVGPDGVRRVDDPSGARKRIAELFEGSRGGPGILLVNARVPHQLHGHRAIDGLVITPNGVTAIEVSDLLQRQRGTLRCAGEAGWTVDGMPALMRTKQANPAQELQTNVYALSEALEAHDIDVGQVGGLVVVVPVEPGDIHLAGHGGLGRNLHVVLADDLRTDRDLRRQLHHQARKKDIWSADGVLAVCEVLGMSDQAPDPKELVEEGFAANATGRTPTRSISTLRMPSLRTPRAAVAPAAVAPEAPAAVPPEAPAAVEPEIDANQEPPTPAQGMPALMPGEDEYRQPPQRGLGRGALRRGVPAVLALLIAVVLGLTLAQWIHQLFHP